MLMFKIKLALKMISDISEYYLIQHKVLFLHIGYCIEDWKSNKSSENIKNISTCFKLFKVSARLSFFNIKYHFISLLRWRSDGITEQLFNSIKWNYISYINSVKNYKEKFK